MSRERFLLRTKRQPHLRAPKQEAELAKRGGGQTTPGSGSGYQKGDVKGYRGFIRIEAKTTSHDSFRVTQEMLDKIEEAALANQEIPVLIIEFQKHGRKVREVAVVPSYILDELNPT